MNIPPSRGVKCSGLLKFLLLDSKSFVPKTKLRLLDKEAIDEEIELTSNNVIQVYKHLRNFFPKFYYPFQYENSIEIENVYGAVVLLEDHFIRRSIIYDRVATKLNIEKNTDEYNWMVNHIKVVSLYDVEKISISKSIIDDLKSKKQQKTI